MNFTLINQLELRTQTCCNCGVMFAMETSYDKQLRETHKTFYCPNGHGQSYTGKTEAEKLRDELKRKEQELANKVREALDLSSSLYSANQKLKRVSKGVCPCCNRTFKNLHSHMKIKHPEILNAPKK